MTITFRKFLVFMGLLLISPNLLGDEVSPEERIAEFRKSSRGLSSPSGSKSSSSSSSTSSSQSTSSSTQQPAAASSTSTDPYAAMSKSFTEQMTANTKANEELQKLIPKAEAEPDYLKNLASASAGGASKSDISAILSQITEATIASIKTLAEMQIAVEKAKAEEELSALRKKQDLLKQQQYQESIAGLSPIAIALGAASSSTPSPVTVRTRVNSEPGHAKGLFPSSLNELSARAYNAPK